MQAPVGFIELRKSKGYTQQQLGLLVAEETARRIKSHYAQKKVSYWESGQTSPNRDEIAALARIFGVQPEEIDSIFRLAPLSAADIFEDLAHSRRPSLVAACYSGRPRATLMREVRSALSRALSHQVFFAMFYPYPSDVESASEPMSDLLRVYEEVWKQVLNHYRDLRSALAPGQRKHIMLYAPVERTNTNFLVPPSNTRYTLVTESIGEAEYRSTLYSWVEAENVDGLYRVGTFSIQQAAPQITAWQAYFGKVLVHWKRCLTLPAGDEYWKAVRVAEAK